MIKINSSKLTRLREYYLAGGNTDPEVVIEALALSGQEELEAYLESLRQKFPDEFPPLETEEEEEYAYFLKTDAGLMQELELVRNKKNVVVFVAKEPKDLVTIILKGKPVEVDLVKLRKLPAGSSEYGTPVERLIELAEIARG